MQLAFTTSLARALPRRASRFQALTSRRSCSWHASASVADSARAVIAENNVMVFSKTTCPYCAAVKSLFSDLRVDHSVCELDTRADGDEIRAFLIEETGQRTVPNVFVGGEHVGGCDDTISLHEQGKLLDMINKN